MEPQRHALLIGVSVSPLIYEHPCLRIRARYQQLSSDRDVELMRALLVRRFGFPEENARVLKTREATREGILTAVAELIGRVGTGDVVVLYYSGHGSRIPALDRETIVPFDAGRSERAAWECRKVVGRPCTEGRSLAEVPGDWAESICGPRAWWGVRPSGESRDIQDVTIAGWIRELNKKTPFVTVIFDCCHSGSVSRPLGTVREAVPDLRPVGELSDDSRRPLLLGGSRSRKQVQVVASGWLPEVRHAVVVAACRPSEYAWEREEPPKHGLLTYHLHQALDELGPKATWMDVLEEAAPRVNREQPAQHPQVEGEKDLYVFGREKAPRSFYLPVSAVDGQSVELSGGAAHGVSPGSVWTVRSGGASSRLEGDEVAKIRVEKVLPVASRARVIEDSLPGRLAEWQRAFLLEQSSPASGLRVAIAAPGDRRLLLVKRLAETRLLTVVDHPQAGKTDAIEDGEPPATGPRTGAPDVTAVCLPARDPAVSGHPYHRLGRLAEWTWVVVDGEDRLQARPRPDDQASVEGLVEDLLKLARFRDLQQMTNPDPESRLRDRLELRILVRREPGAAFEAAPVDGEHGVPVVEDGDLVEYEIENRHDKTVWVSLLQLDLDHSIWVLLPWKEHPYYSSGGFELGSGKVLRLCRDHYWQEDGSPASLPGGFPWSLGWSRGPEVGICYFQLLATTVRANFEFLEQTPTRSGDAPDRAGIADQDRPLPVLAVPDHSVPGTRPAATAPEGRREDQDWTVVTRSLGIRQRLPVEPPPEEKPIPPLPELDDEHNPWLGAEAYGDEQSSLFFGRERLVKELLERLAGEAERSFLTIVGASGSGKTSLVEAGVLPRLPREPGAGNSPELGVWTVVILPALGEDPEALLGATGQELAGAPAGNRRLLVVDRLERLFSRCPHGAARAGFLRRLCRLVAGGAARVLLILRSDFEPVLAAALHGLASAAPALDGVESEVPALDEVQVEPPTLDELRQIVSAPAASRDLHFAPLELADELVAEVYQAPGALALLSLTLDGLYRGAGSRRLETGSLDRALVADSYCSVL